MECHGNGSDHCCYLGSAGVCRYLEENTVEGRRWACGLRRRTGSWTAAYETGEYREHVKPFLAARGLPDCGDWPQSELEERKARGSGVCCFNVEVSIEVS